ncbi:hypothetical protein SDC9_137239 [bioreactor metagenome]|uniref:Uncharacterized protein n=1 Tax=bioreactor metagenome TaxID=1076179 RepID=A0A645DNM2_9ZZZZ
MLFNHLARADLGCVLKRNLAFNPGGAHHSGRFQFIVAHGVRHQVSHAIHHTDAEPRRIMYLDLYGFIGDEFRLGGHDRSAGGALGQLVLRSFLLISVNDIGQYQQIHEPFYERRFSGPDGTHHTDIDVAARAHRNIIV